LILYVCDNNNGNIINFEKILFGGYNQLIKGYQITKKNVFSGGIREQKNFGLGVRQQKRLGTAVLDHHITVDKYFIRVPFYGHAMKIHELYHYYHYHYYSYKHLCANSFLHLTPYN